MKLQRDLPYRLVVSAALAWTSLAVLAPYARARGWPVADALYAVFTPVCHQIPGRSFQCFAQPLAVCHRCLGLYLGFTAGLLVLPALPRFRAWLLARPRAILLFFAPLVVDVALPLYNTPSTRFTTGLIAAFPAGLFVWVAADQLWRQFRERRQSRSHHEWRQAQ